MTDLLAGAASDFSAERLVVALNAFGVSVSVLLWDGPDWKTGQAFLHFD